VVLGVDDKARDEGPQDLSNDVSERLQWREALENGSCNGDTRTEMGPRDGGTDGNGEDETYGIRKTNTKQGYIQRMSETSLMGQIDTTDIRCC
jgi:hypothetical protein